MRRASRFVRRRSVKAGLSPGTLVHIGKPSAEPVGISCIGYDREHVREHELDLSALGELELAAGGVTWINVVGLHRTEVVEAFGHKLSLHPLVLEDVVNSGQRPKLEDYEGYAFIVLRMLDSDEPSGEVRDEQVAIILGPHWVVTFQERPGDAFDPVRERIKTNKGRIRKMGADYLAYCLVDAVVDRYFAVLELIGDRLEEVSEVIMGNPDQAVLRELHDLRQELMVLRKASWPLRNVLHRMQQGQAHLITDETSVFVRDAYDHTVQIIDTAETLREMTTDLRDIYLSSLSNRMNETMKVLTVIATIFIPLTFLAGIYGMNFAFMPELSWRYGYVAVLGLMAAVAGGMLLYFRRRKWL